jgi:hypothetical protein
MSWLSDLWRYGFTAEQRRRSRAAEHYVAAIAAYERGLAELPLAEARAEAERLLAEAKYFRVVPWEGAPEALPVDLAPSLRAVFARVRRVEAQRGEPYLDGADVGPYEWAPQYRQLGRDSEHAYVVVRPNEEMVYIFDETERPDPATAQRFNSVYHWLLWFHRSEQLLTEFAAPAA